MKKIEVSEALKLAKEYFPRAPEQLAELMQIPVRRTPLNCDGYCLQYEDKALITINSGSSETRQRFTLAHELGHIILGIPSVVGESVFDEQNTNVLSKEERRVNVIAGDLLLPLEWAKSYIPEIPVTASVVKKIARKANVSESFVIRRLVFLHKEIGLKSGLVVVYQAGIYQWQWSQSAEFDRNSAQQLLDACTRVAPNPARVHRQKQNDVIVASIIENPTLNITTIFVQVVDEERGLKKLDEEVVRELETYIFSDAHQYKPSVQGCFSSMKFRVGGMSLDEAVDLFENRYLNDATRWDKNLRSRLKSARGREYIELRLKNWINE